MFRIFKFFLGILILLMVLVVLRKDSRDFLFEQVESLSSGISNIKTLDVEIKDVDLLFEDLKKVTESTPLVVEPTQSISTDMTLSALGIFEETNNERVQKNLPPLVHNQTLAKAALAKVDDMFIHQYFEHVSPQGKAPADFVTGAGYAYLTTGENLAFGVFKDEKELVKAWMDSPGHRANILGKQFTEIGVAVKKGLFAGDRVYLAVQEFAKPSSVCSAPDEQEKKNIDQTSATLKQLALVMKERKKEVETGRQKTDVDTYNALVKEYNNFLEVLEENIRDYNKSVEIFNACVKKEVNQ